jgi:hypothetical protein
VNSLELLPLSGWVLALAAFGLAGFVFARRLPLSPRERRELYADITGHFIALLLVLGFLGVVFIPIMGFVDIKDATVTAFVGVVLGYASGKAEAVVGRYFGRRESDGEHPPADKAGAEPCPKCGRPMGAAEQ